MPFVDSEGAALDRVALVYRGGVLFQVVDPFVWIDPRTGEHIPVPAHDLASPAVHPGNATDLASVPPFLWGLTASSGRQTLPAILHDHLSVDADLDPPSSLDRRRRADDAFRIALVEAGVTDLRATTMWTAVGLQRSLRYEGARGLLLVAQVVIGVLVIVAAVVLAALLHPLWLLLALVPAPFALAWGRDAALVLAGSFLGALYSPLVVGAAVASGVEYGVAVLIWLVRGRRGAMPRPGPAIRGGPVERG